MHDSSFSLLRIKNVKILCYMLTDLWGTVSLWGFYSLLNFLVLLNGM